MSGTRVSTGKELDGDVGERTVLKWSSRVTCPNRPSAILRAYSAFLIECIDTASVIVSTRPEELPVINIRKLVVAL